MCSNDQSSAHTIDNADFEYRCKLNVFQHCEERGQETPPPKQLFTSLSFHPGYVKEVKELEPCCYVAQRRSRLLCLNLHFASLFFKHGDAATLVFIIHLQDIIFLKKFYVWEKNESQKCSNESMMLRNFDNNAGPLLKGERNGKGWLGVMMK